MTSVRAGKPKKRGNRIGFWFFQAALRGFHLRGAYGLLYPVCLYYLCVDREAYRGAAAYVRRRFPESGAPGRCRHIYRLLVSQGRQLIDRYAALTGAVPFAFDLRGVDLLRETLKTGGRGMILLTAHVGNWQIAMTTLGGLGKPVNLVMRPEDNEAVKRALRLYPRTDSLHVISPEEGLDGAMEIMNALNRDEIVSFMGDRPFAFKSAPVRFLGDTARFPCGPFQIAAAADCPVQVMLAAREGYAKYSVEFKPLTTVRDNHKGGGRPYQRSMQAYADMLEAFTAAYPYQCFLFTDIWKQE